MTKLFLALSAVLLVLVGVAAAKDSHDKGYLQQQQEYLQRYPASAKFIDVKTQQLFPSFTEAKRGDTFRVERCISCHVPDIATIGPQEAAKRLSEDFFSSPGHEEIAAKNHLTPGHHPAVIDQNYFAAYGPNAFPTKDGFHPYSGPGPNGKPQPAMLPGFVPQFLSPANNSGQPWGIDQVGCIVCHNGSRLELDQNQAHRNLIINPEYVWTEGAALYYQYCAVCHGTLGEGISGPPLSNQDRLGFFNEDYYYRCIEYGATGFEHIGSAMPNWGSVAPDYSGDPTKIPNKSRVLSEDQIHLLVQFIRHWENYETLP